MDFLKNWVKLAVLILILAAGAVFTGHGFAAEAEDKNPLRFWEGQNKSYLKGSFWVETAYFTESNAWFGESEANTGNKVDNWWELVFFPKLEGSYVFDNGADLYGRLSAVYANTDGNDAAGSNNGDDTRYVRNANGRCRRRMAFRGRFQLAGQRFSRHFLWSPAIPDRRWIFFLGPER